MEEALVDSKRYRVERTVRGGMGQVWLLTRNGGVDDPVYPPRLAAKTFDRMNGESAIVDELNHWLDLKHRHILPLLAVGRLNYRTAALMPWRLGSLGDSLSRQQTIGVPVAAEILRQVLYALEYAVEEHSLVHLDIKPANILIRSIEPPEVEVSDWGISRLASSTQSGWFERISGKDARLTQFGAGTLPYMAPERLAPAWTLDVDADMYSLGMMALEMVTGKLPFTDPDLLIEDILYGRYFARACYLLEEVAPELSTFCTACLNPNRKKRPKSHRQAIALLP